MAKKAKKEEKKNMATLSGGMFRGARVTEKATLLSSNSVYVINVRNTATKPEIVKMIQKVYKVKPTKIRVINSPKKKILHKGRPGERGGGKKAYIYLKKGEKIEI
jgi:ribosomal protein L23